jgi:hypothetical protein
MFVPHLVPSSDSSDNENHRHLGLVYLPTMPSFASITVANGA